MPLTIEGSAVTSQIASATSHTLNLPSGITSGEILVVITNSDDSTRWWTHAGYTALGMGGPVGFLWKTATGTEPSTDIFSVNTGSATMNGAVAFRISGLDATNPFLAAANYAEASETSEDPFTLAANSLTGVTSGNDLILAWSGNNTTASRSITTLDAGLTLVNSTADNRLHVAWEENPGTGNSAYSIDMSDTRQWDWILVEANVAAAASGGMQLVGGAGLVG